MVGEDGRISDAELHEPILANGEANEAIQRQAVLDAIEEGIDPEIARKLYGNT